MVTLIICLKQEQSKIHSESLIWLKLPVCWASLVAQMVKNLPALWESWVQSLGWEDPLEGSMATHSSILCLENPHGQRSMAIYSPWGRKELDMTERLNTAHMLYI